MKKNSVNFDLIITAGIFLLSFSVYFFTLCPTVSMYADAGEFPTFAYISGFGHPPGYPLFILILKLFLLLPLGNPAFRSNLASAFIGAMAVAICYLLISKLTRQKFPAIVAALILAFNKIYWGNAVVAEVFTLLALFIASSFLFFLLWVRTGKKSYFYLFLLVSGLAAAHHQLIIISLLPLALAFPFIRRKKLLRLKDYAIAPVIFLSGFLPYLYIYLYIASEYISRFSCRPDASPGGRNTPPRRLRGRFPGAYPSHSRPEGAWIAF